MTGRTGGDRWVGIRSRVSVMVTMSSGMRTCHQRRGAMGCLLTVAARLVCPRWCPFSTVAGVILGPGLRRCEWLAVRHAEKQPSAQKSPHGERPKWETTRVAAVCKNLQCEGANLRAGMRYCAAYSEHRVRTRGTNAAECRRVLRSASPLESAGWNTRRRREDGVRCYTCKNPDRSSAVHR